MPTRSRIDWLSGVLVSLPILIFGIVFFRYAVNVPKWDDHALKAFLLYSGQADSFSEKVFQLFRQHNEHRIVYDRFVAGLDYLLTGELNFVHLMVVGIGGLIGILLVFAKAMRASGGAGWSVLPVSLLLFNLSQWENVFWGMAAVQNFTVVAFVLAALYLLAFREKAGWWAMVPAVLASCTSGNGLAVWPVGFMVLLLRQQFPGTLRWLLAATICIRLYFLGYEKPAGNPPGKGDWLELVSGWFVFNGSAFEAFPLSQPYQSCLWFGAALTLLVVGLVVNLGLQRVRGRRLNEWESFFIGGAAFLLVTGLIVAYARVGFGKEVLLTSRYKIYSLTLLSFVSCYLIVAAPAARKKAVAGLATVFGLLIAFFSYGTFLDETIWFRKYQLTNQFNWTYPGNRPVAVRDSVTERYLTGAPAFYDRFVSSLTGKKAADSTVRLDTLYRAANAFHFGQNSFPVLGLRDEGAYLLLRSDRRSYLFPTQQRLSGSLRAYGQPLKGYSPGFSGRVDEWELDPGRYEVLLLVLQPDGPYQIFKTGRFIESNGAVREEIRKNW